MKVLKIIWKAFVQISTVVAGVVAVFAIIIAIQALRSSEKGTKILDRSLKMSVGQLDSISDKMSKLVGVMNRATEGLKRQAELSIEVSELLQEELTEMRKKPFLTLCFLELPARDRYSFFFNKEDILKPHTFTLSILNTGQKHSNGGTVTLTVPRYLQVNTIEALKGVEVERRKEMEIGVWEGAQVYWIYFGKIRSGGSPYKVGKKGIGGTLVDIALITLSMPDTAVCDFRPRGYLTWPLIYRICSEDDEGLYSQRWLWIYFGIKQNLADSLRKYHRETNLYNEKFRPPE